MDLDDLVGTSINNRAYWQYLLVIIAIATPTAIEFIQYQAIFDKFQSTCYFNEKCKRSLGSLEAFNNILSNILYVLYGIAFMITVRASTASDNGCGIHRDQSLFYALGICLIFIGVYSGLYHVCPSALNYQYDTLFMYIGVAIAFLAMYYKRHQYVLPSAFKTYLILGMMYFINTISLYNYKDYNAEYFGLALWLISDVLIIYVLINGSINIYYASNWECGLNLFKNLVKAVKAGSSINYPKLIFVCIVNVCTIAITMYATFSRSEIVTNWFLLICIMNMTFYLVYYLIQKALNGEIIKWFIWVGILLHLTIMALAVMFFTMGVTDKFLTHEESNALNKPCVLFDYFDYHDIWHMLSATGLYILVNIIYFMDDDLKHVPRNSYQIF